MRAMQSRRQFLSRTGGVAMAGGCMFSPLLAAEAGEADQIIHNARIYTVDDRMPTASAMAIKGAMIMAVGDYDTLRGLAGKTTRIVDAKQMTIVPGFIDCHNHPIGETLVYEVLVGNPYQVEFVTIQSIIDKLKARSATTPAGTWVEGHFFDDTKVKDKRQLTRLDLDKVSTVHPVVVRHRGGHTSFYNSKALEMVGFKDGMPDPFGGTIDKGPGGVLTGRVTDRARTPFNSVGDRPKYSQAQIEERSRRGMAHISKRLVEYGLTGVHHQGGDLAAIQAIRASGELLHRVSYETNSAMLDAMIANGIQTGLGDEWIKFGATSEHGVDGSFSERTMAISTPYKGTNPPYYGNITESQEVLDAWVEKVHRAGVQVNCHANGDVVIDMVLNAVERAQKLYPIADARPKITHCTLINDGLVKRIKQLGAIPAPFTSYAYYNSDKFAFYGEEMMKNCMAFRSFLDAGIPVCAGSDFFPGPFSPLMGMQGMVTRKGWDGQTWGANQRVSVAEALKINSYNGAYASKEEHIKGSITPGKLADFVMLADDPHRVDPETIKDIKIVQTVTGGRAVYQA
ncbi:amidohydrolase [Polymorphobacter sp.]|uniref:amidohydrolase n=1 Tax=Polymorphobacter sp. TaxID=1909290 RepID=UPI003F722E59